ncbi:MAG: aminoacetone oxidase family FAD-binding enzyme [Clostridiaceae bacterium]|jgi:predicted Rossmann fold flavoprotein|nr:aminoacetone oxidase family FAD-binding enzyme [Clostridiaceae bacterium]
MEQESICKVAIVGGGPAGCACAYFLKDKCDITVFDMAKPLKTILPTGGGRCNLAHAEFDFKDLASNYPRGEKFLYSVFSKFATADTLKMFEDIKVRTHIEPDMRIFPDSNSSKDVKAKILKALQSVTFKEEKVLRVNQGENLTVVTDMGSYNFDKVVVATGGHGGYNIAKYLNLNIIEPKPALVGLKTQEDFSKIKGVAVQDVCTSDGLKDDILFTHHGISGPLTYKISSLMARESFPYTIHLSFTEDFELQELLNNNPHKDIINLVSDFVPKSVAAYILNDLDIDIETKCHEINGKKRDAIISRLKSFPVTIVGTEKEGEVVTCGGIDLKEINSKSMECKKVPNVYFIGEVLDIDGFCGGFNLQNCWSTAYVAAESILSVK